MEEPVTQALELLSNPSPLVTSPSRTLQRQFVAFLNHLRGAPYDRDDARQLMAFMAAMASEAKGQLFQDLWALWVSGQKRGGYFVEFGAANGVYLSNTWLLEKKMGWSGVLAEPNPVFLKPLEKNRSCFVTTKCVYSRTGDELEFVGAVSPEFSRLASLHSDGPNEKLRAHSRFRVQTISLNDLLIEAGAPRTIDYMSVDTEGSELEILSAFDFDRWDVRAIDVEHNEQPDREKLYDLLTARGYRRQFPELSGQDDWYVKAG